MTRVRAGRTIEACSARQPPGFSGYAAGTLDGTESDGGGGTGISPRQGAGTALLEKPFTPDALEAAVLEALAGPPPRGALGPGEPPQK